MPTLLPNPRCFALPTLAGCVLLGAASCVNVVEAPLPPSESASVPTGFTPEVKMVTDWLTGSFSNHAQASSDPRFREVEVHMTPIWPDRKDGPWLYVEQAVTTALDRPYRQRIYQIGPALAADGSPAVLSMIYSLPGDPLVYAGAWKDPSRFGDIIPGMLTPLEGCGVTLVADGPAAFKGGTEGTNCASTRGGAAYTTSEIHLDATTLETLDRGFSADGTQVWGSEHGPYRFERVPR